MVLLAPLSPPVPGAQAIPAPDEYARFVIGSDGNLLRWEKIVSYFELVSARSDRVLTRELGKTTNGNPFIVATISSPENLARLDEIQANQRKIADPRGLARDDAEQLAWNSPAVVLMSCNIHSTEIASSQMALKVLHRMATEDSPWVRKVLDEVVFLLVPSSNPDGQIIITDWNNRVRGSKHVWAPAPWLYHPYAGHDNNRDAFLMTQVESRYVNRLLYQEWFPQVYLDQHQQGNRGMRVFVPPFRNPMNPNVDPVIWAEVGRMGFGMFSALHKAGFSGIAYDKHYTGWWQGGFLRGAWFHNMIGLLTEVASANLASPVMQRTAKLGEPPKGDHTRKEWLKKRVKNPNAPSPEPEDVTARSSYPRPWLGGKWTLNDIIEHELVITYALLESAANDRTRLIENQIDLGNKAVEQGKKRKPYAYLFPPEQHDPGSAARLLEALNFAGIEIHEARETFTAGGEQHPAGTRVVLMAQPFRNYAKDLLEPQRHPDPKDLPAGTMNDQPYDMTAWTMPLQMGVRAVKAERPFEASLRRLEKIAAPKGKLVLMGKQQSAFLIRPEPNQISVATNRLLRIGARVRCLRKELEWGGETYPPGTLLVSGVKTQRMKAMAEALGLRGVALSEQIEVAAVKLAAVKLATVELREPRVALYQPWTASMDEGWTRWLLEQYDFRFTPVHDADIREGALREKWDAVILPGDRDEKSILKGREGKSIPREYRGGIGTQGREALKEFVASGGTLITTGDSTQFALRSFELPLKNALDGVKRAKFSSPGSFLRILIDTRHPLAYGMRAEGTAVFKNNAAFETVPSFSFTRLKVIARYPGTDPLQSGWIRGHEYLHDRIAAAEVGYKKGRIILIGFRPQFRAQSDNTFKLLFNAIHSSAIR